MAEKDRDAWNGLLPLSVMGVICCVFAFFDKSGHSGLWISLGAVMFGILFYTVWKHDWETPPQDIPPLYTPPVKTDDDDDLLRSAECPAEPEEKTLPTPAGLERLTTSIMTSPTLSHEVKAEVYQLVGFALENDSAPDQILDAIMDSDRLAPADKVEVYRILKKELATC